MRIRPMTPDDVEAAVALARAQGFRDRHRFFEFVFRTPTARPLVGTIDDRLVATGLATANGSVGWLGGIVVAAEHRRHGFGGAMTDELIRLLRAAGCTTMSLETTEMARSMYERLGFRLMTHYHQLQAEYLDAPPEPPSGARLRRLERTDLPAVFELDRLATAEDRSAPLGVLAELADGPGEPGGWVLERDAAVCGFLVPAERAYGAIVAPRLEDGLYLLDLHRSIVPAGAHVRAGIPDEHGEAWRELLAGGWKETWRAPRMLLGPDVPWRPSWVWGQINSAMG